MPHGMLGHACPIIMHFPMMQDLIGGLASAFVRMIYTIMCSPKFEAIQGWVAQSKLLRTQALLYLPHLFPITCSSPFFSGHCTELQSPQATIPNKSNQSQSHLTPRILKMGPCGDCKCCPGGSCGDNCKCTSCGV